MKSDEHLHYEENYHSQDRKAHRKERKHAIASDRSKYKKTDQEKKEKPSKGQAAEGSLRGLVTIILPEGIQVFAEGENYLCTLKGQLKHERNMQKNLIAVGDFVHIIPTNANEAQITLIEPRHSILSRADNLSRKKEQFIAVNIDQLFIMTSVVFPALKPSLIDRYIIAAKKGNLQPIILINKIDLLEDPPISIASQDFEYEQELYKELLSVYTKLGIPIYPISTKTGEGIDLLKKIMSGKQSVISGQSGVGKSSLLNLLTGQDLAVGGVVEKTMKGSHTTSTTQLIPLIEGGFCIDTPGIRSFGVWDLDKNEIQHYFTEIFEESQYCKYPNCSHSIEPGCAVLSAIEVGKISLLRFASYTSLMEDLSQKHRHR